MRKSPDPIDH